MTLPEFDAGTQVYPGSDSWVWRPQIKKLRKAPLGTSPVAQW